MLIGGVPQLVECETRKRRPPRGTHDIEWFVREKPTDSWVLIARGRFTYDPMATDES